MTLQCALSATSGTTIRRGISTACLQYLRRATLSAAEECSRSRPQSCISNRRTMKALAGRSNWSTGRLSQADNTRSRWTLHHQQTSRAASTVGLEDGRETASPGSSAVRSRPATPSTTTPAPTDETDKAGISESGFDLPANASSTLTLRAAALPQSSPRRLLSTLLSLAKPRLSVLVVLTATASYSLYPVSALLSASTALATPSLSLSTLTLLYLTTGTALCAASANTLNMLAEPQYDARMSRTRMRPLVRGLISKAAARSFALATGTSGVAALYFGVNPTVAILGAANIILYAGVYTPLKRITVLNTWVGAIVGAIPPLMGWAAAAGQYAVTDSWQELLLGWDNAAAWLLAALLFAWQMPHFMSLSAGIGEEYRAAGYRMLAWTNPQRNARVALRYSLALIPVCVGLGYFGVTEWSFVWTSMPVNAWLSYEAWRFWRHQGKARSAARGCFWASVWWLPVVLVLALAQKKGLWARVREAMEADDADGLEEEEEAEGDVVREEDEHVSMDRPAR